MDIKNVDIPATCRQLCQGDDGVKPVVHLRESEEFHLLRKILAFRKSKMINYGGGDADAVRLKKLHTLEMKEFIHLQNSIKAGCEGLVAAEKKRVHQEIYDSLDTREELVEAADYLNAAVNDLTTLNCFSASELMQTKKLAMKVLISQETILRKECNVKRLENLLDTGLKRFNVEGVKLRYIRQEIDMRLKDRECFNAEWRKMICKLQKGKIYLDAIIDQGTKASFLREEIIQKIQELNWKGAGDLWHDTLEMVALSHTLGDLYKKADFLWIKGTIRKTEEEKKRLIREQEEDKMMHEKIDSLSELINELLAYNNSEYIPGFLKRFKMDEEAIYSILKYVCNLDSEMVFIWHNIAKTIREIEESRIENCQRKLRQDDEIEELRLQFKEARTAKLAMAERHNKVKSDLFYAMIEIQGMARSLSPKVNPMLNLLGEKFKVTKNNYHIFFKLMSETVMEMFSLASHNKYLREKEKKQRTRRFPSSGTDTEGSPDRSSLESCKAATTVKKRSPRTRTKTKQETKSNAKLCLDIKTEYFVPRPTRVTYTPCAYCQEEHVFQQPPKELVKPLTDDEILHILTSGKINTPYNINTRTVPGKTHLFGSAASY